MAKALNIPWDESKIEKAKKASEYFGHSSLAGHVKFLLTNEIKRMETDIAKKKKE